MEPDSIGIATQPQRLENSPIIFTRRSLFLIIAQILTVEIPLSAIYFLWTYLLGSGLFSNLQIDLSLYTSYVYLGTLLLQFLTFIVLYLGWWSEHYKITANGYIHREGIIFIKEETYDFDNIDSINLTQGLFGRIFNYGTIAIFQPLHPKNGLVEDVPAPNQVAAVIKLSPSFAMKNV